MRFELQSTKKVEAIAKSRCTLSSGTTQGAALCIRREPHVMQLSYSQMHRHDESRRQCLYLNLKNKLWQVLARAAFRSAIPSRDSSSKRFKRLSSSASEWGPCCFPRLHQRIALQIPSCAIASRATNTSSKFYEPFAWRPLLPRT